MALRRIAWAIAVGRRWWRGTDPVLFREPGSPAQAGCSENPPGVWKGLPTVASRLRPPASACFGHGSNAGRSSGVADVGARRATPPDPRLRRSGLAGCRQLDVSHPALSTREVLEVEQCWTGMVQTQVTAQGWLGSTPEVRRPQ